MKAFRSACHKTVSVIRGGLHRTEHWLEPKASRKRALVRVVRMEGQIASRGGNPGISYRGMLPVIQKAFRLPDKEMRSKDKGANSRRLGPDGLPVRPDAVALVINSPGGQPVQSALIYKALREARESTAIPLFAFVEDVCASGGYYIACAADEIIVDDSSVVGSVGVVSGSFGVHELIKRWGVERRLVTSGERKVSMDPFAEDWSEGRSLLQGVADHIYGTFKAVVTERRGDRLGAVFRLPEEALAARRGADAKPGLAPAGDDGAAPLLPLRDGSAMPASWPESAPEYRSTDDLLQGDVLPGTVAVHFGLADGIGRLEGTMADRLVEAGLAASPDDVSFERVTVRRSLRDFLSGGMGAAVAATAEAAGERMAAGAVRGSAAAVEGEGATWRA